MNTKILDVRQGKVVNPVSELHAKDVRIAELQDALEFSERVAVKVAEYAGMNVDEDRCFTCPVKGKTCHWGEVRLSCEEKLLQAACIEVEEEMDGADQA